MRKFLPHFLSLSILLIRERIFLSLIHESQLLRCLIASKESREAFLARWPLPFPHINRKIHFQFLLMRFRFPSTENADDLACLQILVQQVRAQFDQLRPLTYHPDQDDFELPLLY